MKVHVCAQVRTKKLRIFPDTDHPFKGDPRLIEFEMPPRTLRRKEPLFCLPEGFEPMNRDAYRKRFSHMLPKEVAEALKTKSLQSRTLSADGE